MKILTFVFIEKQITVKNFYIPLFFHQNKLVYEKVHY